MREHVETYDLEERLLCQMLFTKHCEQMDSVFELYMNPETHQEIIVSILYPEVRPSISWNAVTWTGGYLNI